MTEEQRRLVDVEFEMDVGLLASVDALAASRGCSRDAVIDEAVSWFVSRCRENPDCAVMREE